MWPFRPVALVYDIQDTTGADLPEDAFTFYAKGPIDDGRMTKLKTILERNEILTGEFDHGAADAGQIQRKTIAKDEKTYSDYHINITTSAGHIERLLGLSQSMKWRE